METKATTQSITFEQALDQLSQNVKKLESTDLSLEDSLQCFEDGVRLTRVCQELLSGAEQKVEVLMKAQADGTLEFQPLPPQK